MPWPVMLFAAGFGTRMRHLTADRPKPMIEVAGLPLIDHALKMAEDLAAHPIVANLHYKPEMLKDHLARRQVQTILEVPDILDTGGGLRNALPMLGSGPVMTLNTDAIWGAGNPLHQLTQHWDPDQMDGLLMCVRPDHAIGYTGDGNFVRDATGAISRGPGLIYGGAQIIKTERLAEIAEPVFSLNLLWDLMITENRLYAIEYDGKWCDVGHPEGILLAEAMLEAGDV